MWHFVEFVETQNTLKFRGEKKNINAIFYWPMFRPSLCGWSGQFYGVHHHAFADIIRKNILQYNEKTTLQLTACMLVVGFKWLDRNDHKLRSTSHLLSSFTRKCFLPTQLMIYFSSLKENPPYSNFRVMILSFVCDLSKFHSLGYLHTLVH